MEKEKQIEDLAKLMFAADCNMCVSEACPAFGRGILKEEKFTCNNYLLAKALHDAGYGNVNEALKEFAERVKKRIEIDKYTTDITKDYDEEDKNNCEYYNLGLNHAQIIIDFFVKEVCGE